MKRLIIEIIIGAVLIAALIFLYMGYASVKKELRDTRIELQVKTTEIQTYKDKNGNLHAKVDEYNKTIAELKHTSDSIEQNLYANAKAAGIKDRQIQALKYALVESRDSLFGVLTILDNVDSTDINDVLVYYNRRIYFDNGSLKAEVMVPLLESKPYAMTYSYTTELYMTDRWYRPKSKFFLWRWLGLSFQKKQNQFDIRVSDTNANIKVIRDISVH